MTWMNRVIFALASFFSLWILLHARYIACISGLYSGDLCYHKVLFLYYGYGSMLDMKHRIEVKVQ